jgi:hypothetical protein
MNFLHTLPCLLLCGGRLTGIMAKKPQRRCP